MVIVVYNVMQRPCGEERRCHMALRTFMRSWNMSLISIDSPKLQWLSASHFGCERSNEWSDVTPSQCGTGCEGNL